MVMTDDKWWEDWLAKMNKYMLEQHHMPPPPPKPKPTAEEKESNRKKLGQTKCDGCFKECDEYDLDNNLLCEECVKKGSDNPSFIELGDPESAFLFRNIDVNIPELRIVKAINYLECVDVDHCYYNVSHLRNIRPRPNVYRILLDHYIQKHYKLDEKEHTDFQNLAYAILQEFVIFETNSGRGKSKDHVKRYLTIHNLIKHIGIPLNMLAMALKSNQRVIGLHAFNGIEHCHICSK